MSMNIRQQKYKKNRLLGMNQYNAAKAAGYSESTSRTKNHKIERSIKVDISNAFEQVGLTDKAIVEYALEGMRATRMRACDVYVQKDEDGNYKINENSNDFIEVEDWFARHKFFTTALELMGKSRMKGKVAPDSLVPIESLLVELIKKHGSNGSGFKITRVEHSTLDKYLQK